MQPLSVHIFLVAIATLVGVAKGDDATLVNVGLSEWTQVLNNNRKLLVVFYKESGCDHCPTMIDSVSSLAGDADFDEDIQVAKSADSSLISSLQLTTFPVVAFLREKSYALYQGKATINALAEWLTLARSKVTQELFDDSFEHLTQASTGATTGDWLVAFYGESCLNIIPVIESVGVRVHQKTNVAVVDSSKNKLLADRFKIKQCPEIILFKQGKMYRYELPKVDQPSLKSFAEAWYKNSKAEIVLPPKSSFDFLTEHIAEVLKIQLEGPNRNVVLAGLCGLAAMFVLLLLCCFRSVASSNEKQKKE